MLLAAQQQEREHQQRCCSAVPSTMLLITWLLAESNMSVDRWLKAVSLQRLSGLPNFC